jgi:hypothetical protein
LRNRIVEVSARNDVDGIPGVVRVMPRFAPANNRVPPALSVQITERRIRSALQPAYIGAPPGNAILAHPAWGRGSSRVSDFNTTFNSRPAVAAAAIRKRSSHSNFDSLL